jgi:hypothetical protein
MKKKPTPEKSANDWLTEIMGQVGRSGKVDEVPAGWMTQAQIAKAQEVPMTTAFSRITRLMAAGLLQRKKFRIQCGKLITEVWHYYKAEQEEQES